MLKVRFFGSMECADCLFVYVLLNKYDIEYEYIDALSDDDSIQDFCDINDVDELPHLQILENDRILIEHRGRLSENKFKKYIEIYKNI